MLLEDLDRAELIYERLLPYTELNVALAANALSLGVASRYVAMLAGLLARFSDSSSFFEHAIAVNRERDALVWALHSQLDFADMLRRRNAAGDDRRAVELEVSCAHEAAP